MIPVGSLDTPVNARMLISGSSTFDLIKVLPDVGAIAAFAGSDDQYHVHYTNMYHSSVPGYCN